MVPAVRFHYPMFRPMRQWRQTRPQHLWSATMVHKPRQWSSVYASIFQDDSVVAAYQHRPPYPPETFTFLLSLIPPGVTRRSVLDAGCGTGLIARPLAPLVDQVDAVDISEAMIRTGQTLPGGNRPNIRWVSASIETAPLNGPY